MEVRVEGMLRCTGKEALLNDLIVYFPPATVR